MQILYNGSLEILGRLFILIYAHCWELVKSSMGSCGSSSLLFVIVVTV
jgi:hypothetical protein